MSVFKIALLSAFLWELPFISAIFLSKRASKISYRLGMLSLAGMGLWGAGWGIYAGWWISQHLCY